MSTSFKILFLCTGNSARSILGEYLIRLVAPGRFESYSAGAHPTGKVNPIVLKVLQQDFKIDAAGARSKSWKEYEGIHFDFVITVCDNARESCPVWPGQPIMAHWSSPDPAAFEGTDEEKARQTFEVALQIRRRLELFTSLPLEKMERLKLAQAMQGIAQGTEEPSPAETKAAGFP
jgi:protein-tyrosine-phosphatase